VNLSKSESNGNMAEMASIFMADLNPEYPVNPVHLEELD
jgi:hypothetical protein